jgi:PEP-CTERM motif-containing protein
VPYLNNLRTRGVLVIIIVALAAGTAAASRWTSWSPLNGCLFCGAPPSRASSPVTISADARVAPAAVAREQVTAHSRGAAARAGDTELPPPSSAVRVAPESERRSAGDDSQRTWQPWETTAATRVNGADSPTLIGGLSRLSSSSISGGGSSVHVPPPAAPAAPAEYRDPGTQVVIGPPSPAAPHDDSPHGPGNGPPGPPPTSITVPPPLIPIHDPAPLPPGGGATPTVPDPTDPFHEHDNPPPSPFVPPAPNGPIGGSDPGGTLPSGSSPAATPEPASMLLLATGVAAVFGELRRRRVM